MIPDWQTAASELLVTLGDHHCQDVMEEIMTKFEPGVMPHFFIIQTVANMATRNGELELFLLYLSICCCKY